MPSKETNRILYERFCEEVLVRGNLNTIDELVAPNVESHSGFPGQAPGREGFKAALAEFRAAFSDLSVSIRDILPSADKVVGYFTVTGVHRGELFGIPATGKAVSYDEIVIVRFSHGRIVEHWSVADTLQMMQTLGAVVPATEPSSSLPADRSERVQAFFERYADRFNRSLEGDKVDVEEVADSFASHFIEASPAGVHGARNGLLFRWMIPRGFAHYKKLGTTKMLIRDLAVEALDTDHALAKVHWDSRYIKQDGSKDQIEFDVTYLLHFQAGEPKIFAYITGDEERLLREHGLS
jgi:predicted ester cyclase